MRSKHAHTGYQLIAVVAIAIAAFATVRATDLTVKATPTAVGVVNWLDLTDQLEEWQETNNRLEDRKREFQDEDTKRTEEIQERIDALKLIKGTPGYEETKNALEIDVAQYETWREKTLRQIQTDQLREQVEIYKSINEAVAEIAARDGYDLVVWNDSKNKMDFDSMALQDAAALISSRHVFYASDSIDITDAVAEHMNTTYEAEQKQANADEN